MFEFKTFIPHIELEKWIKSYWIVDYKRSKLIREKTIISYDNVCLVFMIDSSNLKRNGIYIYPPTLNKQVIIFDEDLYYIDVSLYPGVFYKLFGIPVSELEDRVYTVEELSLKFDLSILETLFNVKGNINSTIYHLENYLFRIFSDFEEDAFLMNIYQLNKNHNLDNFYLQNRLSVRQVQRKVKDFTGMSPKSIERINRFYDTLKCIKKNKNFLDFGNIALENNFYDQSSFIKEFKFFTGLTPKQFLENADNFLQYKCNIFC